jgi:signal peptidase
MEPTVPSGSLAVVLPTPHSEITEGDIIAFRDPSDDRRRLLHRVVSLLDRRESGSGIFFQTKGDANRTPDPLYASADDLFGRMRWHVPGLGYMLWTLRPPFGSLIVLGLPLGVFGARRWIRRRVRPTRATGTCLYCGHSLEVSDEGVNHSPVATEADAAWELRRAS